MKTLAASDCAPCIKIGERYNIRQNHDGSWPDTDLGLVDIANFKKCPQCGTCYSVRFHAGGMFSDDEIELWRLDATEAEIARILAGDFSENAHRLEALLKGYFKTKYAFFLISQVRNDLTPLIPLAVTWLAGNDLTLKRTVVSVLQSAALAKVDVAAAIPGRIKFLAELGTQAEDKEIVWNGLNTLNYAVQNGADVSEYRTRLKKFLNSNDAYTKRLAAQLIKAAQTP